MAPATALLLAAALALAAPGGGEAPRGRLERLALDSLALGGRLEVEIWVAPGAAGKDGTQVPVLYLLEGDGGELSGAVAALDRLVAEGRVAPVLVVRVPPPARRTGLARGEALERFLVSELVPLVDRRYRTRREAAGRAVLEASGAPAGPLDLASRHPGTFGPCGESASRDASGVGALSLTLACLARDDRVSLDVKDADLGEVLRGLVEGRGVSLVTPPDLKGTVTATVTDVPWEQVLDLVLAGNGYAFVREGKVVRVLRREDLLRELASPVPR